MTTFLHNEFLQALITKQSNYIHKQETCNCGDSIYMYYHYYLFIAAIEALMKDKKFYEVDMRHLRVEMEKVALLVNENKGKKILIPVTAYVITIIVI
mgnify:CR=1 FL=1